jgi:diguanylate cyclase (GGDEF)-like protein
MASGSAVWQLVTVWCAGLGALLLLRDRGAVLTLARAVWCNVGVVALALLAPHSLRFLLLAPVVFGVIYAALSMPRTEVWLASAVTFGTYAALVGIVVLRGDPDPTFELAGLAGFAAMLLGVNFLADEIIALRRAFESRRRRLDGALARLSELAVRDELTGVYNRRYVDEVLTRQKALAERGQLDFTVCFCDLDGFKDVNDGWGHGSGDELLVRFANLAAESVRSVDFVARWGGDEFLLVLVGADERDAETVTSRLRDQTRWLRIRGQRGAIGVSVSIGVARFRRGERISELLERADAALYEAKAFGRNRVVVAPARRAREVGPVMG